MSFPQRTSPWCHEITVLTGLCLTHELDPKQCFVYQVCALCHTATCFSISYPLGGTSRYNSDARATATVRSAAVCNFSQKDGTQNALAYATGAARCVRERAVNLILESLGGKIRPGSAKNRRTYSSTAANVVHHAR